ncbi:MULTISPECIES: hypothetical protein [unclassified Bradyrhizobium]|uniref:hypothetical protein n=1 Tax=unclassified Bradyrhizobium TaxID=2631580 RepID=UPI0004171AD0|nr:MULTISPECIES: hypothetical protein [unclassified Bradyrhizobium]QIG94645.1 hypothetical protein G6P99_20945 [Bradyrhizobium sp. 6(2017)]
MHTMTIPRRFRGPPNSGNGGYVCGALARQIAGAAEVTLRAPPPLETELDLVEVEMGVWEIRHGAATIAIGRAVMLDLSRLERATFDEAVEAEKRTPIKPHEHQLPMCFVCGPDRAAGDGLRLFAGPLIRQQPSGVFAVPWTPDASLTAADGLVAPEFVWSALDCPTGYVAQYDSESRSFNALPILLGRLSVRIDGRPRPGERCVVTSWKTGGEGRRLIAEAALFGEEENLLAIGRAVWIVVDRQVQLGSR